MVLIATYLFGMIVDRVGDAVFSRREAIIRLQEGFGSARDYQRARSTIYDDNEPLRDWFSYQRSRFRISRGWIVNSLLLAAVLPLIQANSDSDCTIGPDGIWIPLVALSMLFLAMTTTYCRNEYKRLAVESEELFSNASQSGCQPTLEAGEHGRK
jgi:hypothetical protein